jgi:hypothetical protein
MMTVKKLIQDHRINSTRKVITKFWKLNTSKPSIENWASSY